MTAPERDAVRQRHERRELRETHATLCSTCGRAFRARRKDRRCLSCWYRIDFLPRWHAGAIDYGEEVSA